MTKKISYGSYYGRIRIGCGTVSAYDLDTVLKYFE